MSSSATPSSSSPAAESAYAAAGVDVAAGERAVDLMRAHLARTRRPEVLAEESGFAGLFRLDTSGYSDPVLATSTDGVGTKVMLAQQLDRHDTIGQDLVGMVVDDLVVCGAEPLYLTDYIACGSLVPERIADIVGGIATGCEQAGCTLLAGETAEHPGALEPHEYDLAGSGTGIVEGDAILGPRRVHAGDALVALGSSGPHANGYSLVRRIIADAGLDLYSHVPELGGPLGEVLLEPTRIYAAHCLELIRTTEVRALSHITGGGLAANLERALPDTVDAIVDRGTWAPDSVFEVLAEAGSVTRADMEATFNMGVGMVAVVAEDSVNTALALLQDRGIPAWQLGTTTAGEGRARLVGTHGTRS
ncbi:phosphoribosylformylglycinamidine cyclo-ligase [Lipingzhangella sp. LS1_29]|uniref:Phosphoribosylformylglycinamidine cyclo-ligase n=1 Tax=Lipingzhangella rawalii TaxID=2055835 RepID=A0ABU2H9A6_9ACTN|nr:phosphoribosylformylglycinamidine cyclo-ligase [Lipingzhangella rawalii]MDS1271887.1 phosphoribosylformylglycinamidine cyclo-ligase [Lipingzhangella rawalii]